MTAHDHKVPTPGCYRCELNEDEMNPAFNVRDDYTPTMDDLRDLWLEHMINSSPGVRGVALALLAQAQFDQAIAEHDRQVAEAAWDEGKRGKPPRAGTDWRASAGIVWPNPENPYRKAEADE